MISVPMPSKASATLVLAAMACVVPAHAASLSVNTLVDEQVANGQCSLREAIIAANSNADFNDCIGTGAYGADTISFSVSGTIGLASELPAITDANALTINGPGAAKLGISGNNAVRVLSVNAGATLELRNLTISNGATGERVDGAGINNSGTLTIRNCTLSGNVAGEASSGGAISSTGALTIVDSLISGNSANQGGAVSSIAGSVTITNSTLSDNRAVTANPTGSSEGGAIFSFGTLTIGNSTVSGNSAKRNGGIEAGGTVTITNSTVSGNVPTNLGNAGGQITLMNSIVAGGLANCSGTFIDGGGNLDDAGSCGFTAPTSKANTPAGLDPAGLKDNGGPTQTLALCQSAGKPAGCTAASAAIDMGVNSICAAAPVNNKDQRGLTRPQDGDGNGSAVCDIGAFEVARGARLCSNLGDDPPPSKLDQDIYTFSGAKDEDITLKLEELPMAQNRGKDVSLLLASVIDRKPFARFDRGALPNGIVARLPASGTYYVAVAEEPQLRGNAPFTGGYCLMLDSSMGASGSLKATQTVEFVMQQ